MKQGIALIAHGSRDPEWRRPFERIAAALEKRLPSVAVVLCYLEHGPSIDEALAALVAKGAGTIRVVPLFLGTGGHLRHDLRPLVDALRTAHPGTTMRLHAAIGEHAAVSEAMARAALVAAGVAAGAAEP